MPELLTLLILYATGCFAGAVNVMAGGGSTLSLPVLIMLGMDAGVANGTNRIAITIQNVAATTTFARERRVEWARCLRYAAWALPGAIIGSFTATQLADEWTERVIGILLILVVLSMAWPAARKHTAGGALRSHWMGPALLGIGFYGGFIQMGVGFFFMAAFYPPDAIQSGPHQHSQGGCDSVVYRPHSAGICFKRQGRLGVRIGLGGGQCNGSNSGSSLGHTARREGDPARIDDSGGADGDASVECDLIAAMQSGSMGFTV